MSEAPVDLVGALSARRARSKTTDAAPSRDELLRLLAAAANVADHSGYEPWRVIELRGAAREGLGLAIAEGFGLNGDKAASTARKPLRAPLLLALVVSRRPSLKVPAWEQEATAAGVAHNLGLLLDAEGWNVLWRTGLATRTDAVRRFHGLAEGEDLLGWLYVGGRPVSDREDKPRKPRRVEERLSAL